MDRFMYIILKRKKTVLLFFLIATVLCMLMSTQVGVNYNIMDYLPDEAPSTEALDIMDAEYAKGAPNARVMVREVTIPEALAYKEKIKAVDGVTDISWLDDAIDIYQPLAFAEQKTVEEYYVDNNAVFTVTVDEDRQVSALNQVRQIIGNERAMSGNAVNTVTAIQLTTKEIQKIMIFAVALIFVILLLTTTAWVEPVLFLVTIGVAIMLNMGTNLFFGEISFVTNAAGSILQMAVSMDYSIFLLHRFSEYRTEYDDVTEAMSKAVKSSFGSIMSSGLTTVMGFAALILMRFKIGPDMGIVMAKAIAISLFTVLLFFPALTLVCYKMIDKTQHKLLIPPFDKFAKLVMKIQVPALILFIVITIPCFLGQDENSFTYGQSGIYGPGTQLGDDTAAIEEIFGKSNLVVLMVPKGTPANERALSEALMDQELITSVISYAETVGTQIPVEFAPADEVSELISDRYSRMVITLDTDEEGDKAFAMTEKIRDMASQYYGNEYQLAGVTVNSYDMRDVVTKDNERVNALAIGSIALILLLNFKSLLIPVVLLLVIESSIWINLTVPYFMDERLFYIGYLIISSIQLGATVDYAILFADRYIENRRDLPAREAACKSLSDTALSILTSASILTFAGLMLGIMSTNGIISQLGMLVGRGGVLSGVLVLFVLPSLLVLFDKPIYYLTYKLDFYQSKQSKRKEGTQYETLEKKL